MRIFGMELKKFLNWKLLLVLLAFTALFYQMHLRFVLFDYPNGDPQQASLAAGEYMLEHYGTSLDAAEQTDFTRTYYADLKNTVDRKIRSLQPFRDAGIRSTDEFQALEEKTDDASRKLSEKLFWCLAYTFPRTEANTGNALDSYNWANDLVDNFQIRAREAKAARSSLPKNAAEARRKDLALRKTVSALPAWPVYTSWNDLTKDLALLLFLSAMITVSIVPVRERRSGVRSLAYPCRKGRALFGVQLGAACAAALLAVLAQFGAFWAFYRFGPHRVDFLFFSCGADNYCWRDMTFGRYAAVTCGMLVCVALGFALFSFAVSSLCKSYVAVLAAQIPAAYLGYLFCTWFFHEPLNYGRPVWFAPLVCAAFLVLPLGLCLWLVRREKRRDAA